MALLGVAVQYHRRGRSGRHGRGVAAFATTYVLAACFERSTAEVGGLMPGEAVDPRELVKA